MTMIAAQDVSRAVGTFYIYSFLFYFTNYYLQIDYEYLHHLPPPTITNARFGGDRGQEKETMAGFNLYSYLTTTGARNVSRAVGMFFLYFTLLITNYRSITNTYTTYHQSLDSFMLRRAMAL